MKANLLILLSDGTPAPFASVEILKDDGTRYDPPKGGISNGDGVFSETILPGAILSVSYVGHKPAQILGTQTRVTLQPKPGEGPEIVVRPKTSPFIWLGVAALIIYLLND